MPTTRSLFGSLVLVALFATASSAVVACGTADGTGLQAFPEAEVEEDDPHGDDTTAGPASTDPAIGAEGVEPEEPEPVSPDAGRSSDAGRDAADASRDAAVADASTAPARAASPVPGRSVTYAYGVRNSRYAAGYHTGEDYAAPTGTNVVAVRNGIVRWSNDAGGAYGKWMGVEADNGRVYVYCHLSVRNVATGTTVKANQVIGKVGATGNVTGPHLHFEDHPKGPFQYAKGRKPSW